MLDFVLFDETLSRRFGDAVAALGLSCEIDDDDPMGGYVIRVLGEIDDDAAAALEAHYDELMAQQQDLIEDGGDGQAVMGIDVVLADGQPRSILLPAVFARRLHEHFEVDEIRELVTVIAEAAVHPESGPLCCRIAE